MPNRHRILRGDSAVSIWAFYGRVSGLEQATNNSIPTQREACQQKALALGATEVLDFVDAGVPGDLDWTDRPALNRLLSLAEAGAIAGLIAYDPDRLARDLGVQLAITELLAKHQVRLEFVTQEFNASPEGMLFYQIRGAVSQFERAKIRERTGRGRKKILREGIPANKPGIYGLTYDRPTNTWSVQPEHAEVVRQIFRWFAEGRRPAWIAQTLNESGIRPLRGARWWKTTVAKLVTNSTYAGKLYLNRYNHEGEHKNRFLPPERRHKASMRPPEQWIEVAVPAIVEPPLWEAVQHIRRENGRRWSGRTSKHGCYLASRLIRCGLCGSPMNGTTARRGAAATAYYRCAGRYGEKRLPCPMPHLHAPSLDEALWQAICTWLNKPDRYQQAASQAQRNNTQPPPTPQSQNAQLKEVQEDMARLQSLISRGAVREHEVRSAIRGLAEREKALLLQLRTPEEPPPSAIPAKSEDFTFAQRQACVRGLVANIIAHPNGDLQVTPRDKARLP